MVKERKVGDRTLFLCEVCGFGYLEKETAEQCEEGCKRTHSCSLAITKKAVYFPDPFKSLHKR